MEGIDPKLLEKMSIGPKWESYMLGVIPENAPAVQITESRRVFYAGAWAVLSAMQALGGVEVPEHVSVGLIQHMIDECKAFMGQVAAGEA